MAGDPKVSVIGLGNWGTSLAHHLSKKGLDVLGWSRNSAEVASLNEHGKHPRFPGCSFTFKATTSLEDALVADYIVVAIPSAVLHQYADRLSQCTEATIISAIKGFDPASLLTPLQLIQSRTKTLLKLCVLSGPSFAADVVQGRPCSIVAASTPIAVAESVAELFSNETMRVYHSSDAIGAELGGALKNVIAVAAGVCDGLGFGISARSALITRGLAEITRLAEAMGANRATFFGLSGLGDLAMTSASLTSRNYTVGYRLGQDEKLPDIIASLGSVAEGVTSTPIVLAHSKKHGVDTPIAEAVSMLLNGKVSAIDMARSLMVRPRRKEF